MRSSLGVVRFLAGTVGLAALALAAGHAKASGPVRTLNDGPRVIFSTTPPADAENAVFGKAPFTVTFNMCKTLDGDAGDELKFTYDFEGTGVVERGRCRGSHTYRDEGEFKAVVCASDRQPDHEVCARFLVNVRAGAPGPSGKFFFSTSLAYADVDGDGCADYVSIPWSVAGALGSGATQQVWIPLADTNGDGKPDSIVMDLDNNGVADPTLENSGKLAGGCPTSTPTSTSRMVSPSNPILVDVNGNGPDGADTPVSLIRIGPAAVLISAPWSGGSADFLQLGGGSGGLTGTPYTTITRSFGNVTQNTAVTGFNNGGVSQVGFDETGGGGGPKTGQLDLVDTNGDGIFDTVQGAEQ